MFDISAVNQVPFYTWNQPSASNSSCDFFCPAERIPAAVLLLFSIPSLVHPSHPPLLFFLHFLLFLHLSFHSNFILNFPRIYHSLYLCLLALYVCIDFVAVHAPCFSPFLIEGVKWSLSLPNEIKVVFFFSPLPFFGSLAPLQQAQTPSALNLRVWNELPLLWLSTHLCALSLAHCSPSLFFSPLTSQVHFSLMHLFVPLPK